MVAWIVGVMLGELNAKDPWIKTFNKSSIPSVTSEEGGKSMKIFADLRPRTLGHSTCINKIVMLELAPGTKGVATLSTNIGDLRWELTPINSVGSGEVL